MRRTSCCVKTLAAILMLYEERERERDRMAALSQGVESMHKLTLGVARNDVKVKEILKGCYSE